MNSIYLDDAPVQIEYVYSAEARARLSALSGIDGRVYTKSEVLASPEKFRTVRFIFTTWGFPAFTADEIKTVFPALECVFYAAGSVQYFAKPFLECGVRVFSAWAANGVPVAEYTAAQIILAGKGFLPLMRGYSSGDLATFEERTGYPGNYGGSVGIIGAGMIGRLVIEKLRANRLNLLVFDPFLPDETASGLGVRKCSLEELFGECQVVSNHLANNEQTRGMLGYELFRRMRPNAAFINTGRGAQVIEDDLVRILTERPDITALLDVTIAEPLPSGHPFYALPNCFLTPHIAGSLGDEVHRLAEFMLDEYELYAAGKPCRYEVTERMLGTMA